MIYFSKFSESVIENGKRILKVLQFGAKTADESSPFGVDSNPIKGMTAIYSDTSNNSESVILGYINESQLAEPGEVRFYSLDSNKAVKAFIWLKANGDIQLNGNTYTSVRFEPLKTGLQNSDNALNAELAKIQTAIGLLGGSYTRLVVNTDIDESENNTVKLG